MHTLTELQIEKVARNINAMDLYYHYIDNHKKWQFWSDLRDKLTQIIGRLNDADKQAVKALCKKEKAEYFGL